MNKTRLRLFILIVWNGEFIPSSMGLIVVFESAMGYEMGSIFTCLWSSYSLVQSRQFCRHRHFPHWNGRHGSSTCFTQGYCKVFRPVTHVDSRYNQMDMQEDVQEDSGWKLVHGDVFRPPKRPLLLSVLLGSGSQLFMMVGATTSKPPLFVFND